MVKLFLERRGTKLKIYQNIRLRRVLFRSYLEEAEQFSIGRERLGLKSRWNFDQPAKC